MAPTYYKYCSPQEHYVDILVSCTVRATQPAALNDPFEMAGCPTQEEILRFASAKPDAIPGLAEALTIDTDRQVERIRHECSSLEKAIIAQSGVICVSSEWDLLSECRDTGRDDFRGHRIYLYTLPPRCISEITIGARMDAEYGGRLSGLAKARGARVFQATYDIGSPRLVREEVT